MPEISRFLGIIITMYWSEPKHNVPHFHARYNEFKAQVGIEELKIIEGELPPRVSGLIVEWASQHKIELMQNWELLKEHKHPNKIQPLV
jgi:hypothetical protein